MQINKQAAQILKKPAAPKLKRKSVKKSVPIQKKSAVKTKKANAANRNAQAPKRKQNKSCPSIKKAIALNTLV